MAEYPELQALLKRYASMVDWFVYSELARGSPDFIYKAGLHLFRAGGKRFRPFLVLAFARMLGGPRAEEAALPLAAAVELFHTFTLIHDDIMDEDETRRGVPTTHVVYGVPYAILAGDLDYALSYRSIWLATRSLPGDLVATAYNILTEASIRVVEGQAYDMSFEKMLEVDYNDYLQMIYLKTSALIEASAKLGALAAIPYRGEQDRLSFGPLLEAAGQYGRFVGLAFQIRDDVLGVFGDPAKTGKPIYSDLRRGKKTILVLYAYKRTEGPDRELIEKVLRGQATSEEELRRAAEVIRRSGALDYAMSLARRLSQSAIEILDQIDAVDATAKAALEQLARFTVEREK